MRSSESIVDIWTAAKRGNLSELKRFLNNGVSPDVRRTGKITPLHEAAEAGQFEAAEWLLAVGADPNAKTISNRGEAGAYSPLHLAVSSGHSDVARLLLGQGAKANARMSDGTTPLILSVERDNFELTELLIEKGAAVQLQNGIGASPLSVAVFGRSFQTAQYLIVCGADPNQRMDPFNATLLMVAAATKELNGIKFLLAVGADPQLRDDRGQTALHHAVFSTASNVTQWSSADGEKRVQSDNSADGPAIVSLLLTAGGDPLLADDEGKSALDWARKLRQRELVQMLESKPRK